MNQPVHVTVQRGMGELPVEVSALDGVQQMTLFIYAQSGLVVKGKVKGKFHRQNLLK